MSFVQRPPAEPQSGDGLADNVEGLLRAFFRAEIPEPWPVPKTPAETSFPPERVAPQRRSLVRSRLVLAASVLLLLVGQLTLFNMLRDHSSAAADASPGKNEATNRTGLSSPKLLPLTGRH